VFLESRLNTEMLLWRDLHGSLEQIRRFARKLQEPDGCDRIHQFCSLVTNRAKCLSTRRLKLGQGLLA